MALDGLVLFVINYLPECKHLFCVCRRKRKKKEGPGGFRDILLAPYGYGLYNNDCCRSDNYSFFCHAGVAKLFTSCAIMCQKKISEAGRHSQVVRQRSAKPLSPVRVRVSPPKKNGPPVFRRFVHSAIQGCFFFGFGPSLCLSFALWALIFHAAWGASLSRCLWALVYHAVCGR